ncbi:Mu transposase C-terminal domain-containing protein [Pseudoalteromonas phenolica]|uniref:Mu transposase C-terminal domain-containing protein n=1 Tax=Pseudoalteromonas phenolica TaxID=161398 RepID=UPI00384A6220
MQLNQKLISTNKNPAEFLIVDVNPDREQVAVVDMLCDPPKRPKAQSFAWVQEKLASKELKLEEHDHSDLLMADDSELKPSWIRRRNEAYEMVSGLVDDPIQLDQYLYGDSSGILARLIKESGRSRKWVQASINRYFRYGSVPNALLPHYEELGKKYVGPAKPIYNEDGSTCLKSKPGPNTKYGNAYRYITGEDKSNIFKFSKKLKDLQEVNLQDLYEDYCKEYCVVVVRPEGVQDDDVAEEFYALLPRVRLISPRAFKRYLKKCIGTLEFIRRRTGSILYEKDYAGKPGLAAHGLRGPRSRYEIDSTTADVYIRYEYSNDEQLSIGRPTIYFVIDVVSSMIVGVHVCFHGPDWHAESQALFNAFTDKVEFCRQFGIEITHEDWPCSDVCNQLTLDRGTENSHNAITSLLKGKIGIKAANFNAYHRGDCKGTVEKAFDIIQGKSIPQHEGKVYKAPKKEDAHPSRGAMYTYKQFMQRLIREIIHHNNTAAKVDNHNFEMCRDEVGLTPRDIWNWGIKQSIFPPIKKSKAALLFALMKKEYATVTDKGVKFRGVYYNSPDVIELKWLDTAKNDGRFKVEIRYTDVNSSHIWCRHPDDKNKVMQMEITERSCQYKNRLWAQVLAHQEKVKEILAQLDEERFSQRVLLNMSLEEMDNAIKDELRKLKKSQATSPDTNVRERKQEQGDCEKQVQYQEVLIAMEEASSFTNSPDPHVIGEDDLKDPTYKRNNVAA